MDRPVHVREALKSTPFDVQLVLPTLATESYVEFSVKAPRIPVISCVPRPRLKLSTFNLTFGRFACVIVSVLLPPTCPLALLLLVASKNLPSIFSQVVLKYLVAGFVGKVVI